MPMPRTGLHLQQKILDLMGAAWETTWDEARFDALALQVVHFQLEANPLYRRFCLQGGRPAPAHWREARAVPTDVFKALPICTFPPEAAVRVFRTSGTTAGQTRGAHYFVDLTLYDAALRPGFLRHMLPEGGVLPMLALMPEPESVQDSSLSYMVGALMRMLRPRHAGFYVSDGTLQASALQRDLEQLVCERQPVCLLGTAFAFVWWLEFLGGRSCPLPPGSRIMETGGFKGKVEAIERAVLYERLSACFQLPSSHIVAEYGMTELSSQLYDGSLRSTWEAGGLLGTRESAVIPRRLVPPPWLKVSVVDPVLLEPLPEGAVGLVRFFDLANLGSVAAVQTSDLGRWTDGGLELRGRAAGADARGCSLAIEELRVLGRSHV